MDMPVVITKDGCHAVMFTKQGRTFLTLFTGYRQEADAWLLAVRAYGWSVSGRPTPIA